MEKQFKHKKTGEIITYKDGVIKSGSFVLEIGCEPSTEYWEEITKKSVLFTTEDGVSIKEGDNYWFIWVKGKHLPDYQTLYHPYFIENATKLNLDEYWSKDAKFFSTEKVAKDFIIYHKPCLSIKEILSAGQRIIVDEEKLKQLVKAKIDL